MKRTTNGNFVALRRGITQHVQDGRITGLEYLALLQLIIDADAGTGGYNVNGPLLMYRTGYVFNLDTAQRILKSLHDKQYVWYRPKAGPKTPQPYWINRYLLTKEQKRFGLRYTDLSQLFDKSTISQQDVWSHAGQLTGHDTDEYKKTRMQEDKKTKQLPILPGTTFKDELDGRPSRQTTSAAHEGGDARPTLVDDLQGRPRISYASPDTGTDTPIATPPFAWWGDFIPGYRFVDGADAGYVSITTGKRINFDEAKRLAETRGSIQ